MVKPNCPDCGIKLKGPVEEDNDGTKYYICKDCEIAVRISNCTKEDLIEAGY